MSTLQREGPIGPDWVKTAYLITTEGGVIVRRPVKCMPAQKKRYGAQPEPVDKYNSGRAKRRYRIVARRLMKGAAENAKADEALQKKPRSARDGPPLKEASP